MTGVPDANSLLGGNDLNNLLAGLQGPGNPLGVQPPGDNLHGLGDLSGLYPGLNTNLMDQLGLNLGAPTNSGGDASALQKTNSLGSLNPGDPTAGQGLPAGGMTANALAGLQGMGFNQGLAANPANNLLGQLSGIAGIPGLGNPTAGL